MGQESKAGLVSPPATGYIAISPGPEMRAGHGCTSITPFVDGGSSEEFVGRGKLKNILFAKENNQWLTSH